MLNKTLQKELEKGLPGPIYYLWSEESCFLDDALAEIPGAVIPSGSTDFNYDVFDSSSNIPEILDTLSTLPFMAPRRLVVLKDFNQLAASVVKSLMSYFNDPSESTCMVVASQKAPKKSLKVDWKVFSLNIRDSDIPAWLRHAAMNKGIKLTGDAVDSLIEYVGYDVGLLLMEVEKLTLSGKSTVTGKDIVSTTSMMRKYSTFDLLDSLIAGQKSRAFRIMKTIFGGSPYEAPAILGTLNWHYKQFYLLWQNKGKRPMKMREKTYRALMKYVPLFKEGDFFTIFQSLHEADVGIKTSGRPELVMDILLIKLLQKGSVT
jgi:DNA polymerase III delta subunit